MTKMKDGIFFESKKRKPKAKDVPETQENKSETEHQAVPVPDQQMDLTIVYDEKLQCLVGVNGGLRCSLLNGSMNAGEIWKCQILPSPKCTLLPDAFPIEKIGMAEKRADVPMTQNVRKPAEKKTKPAEKSQEVSELQAQLREKSTKLREANLRMGRMQKQINSIPGLKENNKQLERANKSLTVQVKQLESKLKDRHIDNLTSERDMYKQTVEEQKEEIARLRATLELFNSGAKVSSVTTYLTGESSLHCNLLDDGGYKVYFSPSKRTLRFIPDEKGSVECVNRDVIIPAIAPYTDFAKIRTLEARKEDSEVVVSLV